ncbi:MAG: VWA domain-containing protein [Bacillota bacterium]
MVFSFSYPLLLALLPVLAAFVLYTSRRLARLPGWRRRTVITLRIIIILLIVLCIAGLGLKNTSSNSTTVFVVDGSDSTSGSKSNAEAFVREALRSKKPSDKAAVINFGADALVEFTPTDKPNFTSLQTKINGSFTNIGQALKYAASLIPAQDRKRIVLLSDGEENVGNALKEAKLLKEQGISIDVFKIENKTVTDVQVKDIKVPEILRLDEKFEVHIKLNSNTNTKARLKLYRDRELTSETDIDIRQGENNFVFSDTAQKGGVVTYSAEIEPLDDTLTQNNKMSSFSYIEDIARILVIHDSDEGGSELSRMLKGEARVTVSKPENVPVAVEDLQKYDGYIISNVSAERFEDAFLDSLEICIKHMGKGLLVTGGDESYALGGYYKTVLEKVLPVNMDIKAKEEDPNLGLVLAIDKSGSMSEGQYGISKVELAKEAAIRSTEVLKSRDMIGVIGFDGEAKWVVETQKVTDLKGIQDAIGTIRADGGTSILPSLEEAYLSLKDADTKLKHIILLTDGHAEKSGYEPVLEKMNKAGITLSTVAVGNSADTLLLKALAYVGKGRFYATDEFTDIPKIFAKETFLAGKTYLNNRTFTPKLKSYSPILNEIESIPTLDGYIGTTPKGTARVIFTSDEDDPVLAVWQYGLGRTAAWTSDAKGMWTSNWLAWDKSPKFWKNLVSWLIQKKVKEDYSVTGGFSEGKGDIELRVPPDENLKDVKVEAVIISPSGKEEKASLNPVSPGVYNGTFSGDETGVYITNISLSSKGETIKSISTGIIIPYSPEYDVDKNDSGDFMERLSYESGGRIIRNAREVFAGKLPAIESINDMTPLLLILILILFMIDIAIRRLNLPFGKVEALLNRIGEEGARFTDTVVRPVIEKANSKRSSPGKMEKNDTNNDVSVRDRKGDKNTIKGVSMEASKNNESYQDTPKANTDTHVSKLLDKKRKRER